MTLLSHDHYYGVDLADDPVKGKQRATEDTEAATGAPYPCSSRVASLSRFPSWSSSASSSSSSCSVSSTSSADDFLFDDTSDASLHTVHTNSKGLDALPCGASYHAGDYRLTCSVPATATSSHLHRETTSFMAAATSSALWPATIAEAERREWSIEADRDCSSPPSSSTTVGTRTRTTSNGRHRHNLQQPLLFSDAHLAESSSLPPTPPRPLVCTQDPSSSSSSSAPFLPFSADLLSRKLEALQADRTPDNNEDDFTDSKGEEDETEADQALRRALAFAAFHRRRRTSSDTGRLRGEEMWDAASWASGGNTLWALVDALEE